MHVSWRKKMSRLIRGRLRSMALSKHGVGVVTETKNGLLVVDPRDFGVSSSLLSQGCYDWTAISWLLGVLNQESRIVFVGAHLGALLVPIALRSGSRHIVAFEPAPRNHWLLKVNLAINGLSEVIVHCHAVGAMEGSVRFTENPINTGNSRISPVGESFVPMTTLDTALRFQRRDTDLLVLDVEGFEVHAMRGATWSLEHTRYFYVEFAPEQLMEQGSSAAEFIDVVASRFDSMYLQGNPTKFFPSKTYVNYLRELPMRRGLLLNLLFSNEASAELKLLTIR